jgi:hypothetical protein
MYSADIIVYIRSRHRPILPERAIHPALEEDVIVEIIDPQLRHLPAVQVGLGQVAGKLVVTRRAEAIPATGEPVVDAELWVRLRAVYA